MEIRHMEAFAAVMSTGSVTRAGQLLGRSQSVVSRIISDLEEELGYPLFERMGPRVKPTDNAHVLYRELDPLLAGLKRVRQRARHIADDTMPPLGVVATAALSAGLVPAALRRHEQQYALPHAIALRTATAEQIVSALLSGSVDLGISSLPLDHDGLDLHWIGEAPCVAVVAEDDPLCSSERIVLAALAQRRLLTLMNNRRLRRRLDDAFTQAGIDAPVMIENSQSLSAIMEARQGLGVAIVDPISACGIPVQGVAVKPLNVQVPFYFGVFSVTGRHLSRSASQLMGALEEVARTSLQGFQRHDGKRYRQLLTKPTG